MSTSGVGARVVLATSLLALSLVTVPAPLDGDIRYEIGAQATSPADAAGTFTHRPLMYRLLMSALVVPADGLSNDMVWFERVVRLEALGLAFLAGVLLWLGLRRYVPALATTLGVVVTAALSLIGPATVLEPEWLALVATVAGVGLALALPDRPPWGVLGAVLGGLLLMVAAAVKAVTLPVAVIGLLALLILDRRRCLIAAAAALGTGLAYVAAVARWVPWEVQWMMDTSAMVPPRGAATNALEAAAFLGNVAIVWPAVILLPAALVSLPRVPALVAGIGALLAWLPVTLQNQYFLYHASPLAVVAAVCLYGALRRLGVVALLPALALSGWSVFVLTSAPEWRLAHQPQLFAAAGITAGVALLLAIGWRVWRGAPGLRVPARAASALAVVSALVVVATNVPAASPASAESVTLSTMSQTPRTHRAALTEQIAGGAEMRRRVGAGTSVTYLTFGSYNYLTGLPGTCEFPTSVFLQRSRSIKRQEGTPTWQANLRCLTDKPGEVLVWDQTWFLLRRQPLVVQAAIAATWDCDKGWTVDRMRVCPRRS